SRRCARQRSNHWAPSPEAHAAQSRIKTVRRSWRSHLTTAFIDRSRTLSAIGGKPHSRRMGFPVESLTPRSASIGRVYTRMENLTQTQRTRPSELVRTEARALLELAIRVSGPMLAPFARATELVVEAAGCGNRVIVLGMGKSGLIARKIAATLRSTGTAAHFLHPAEALHGYLGMIAPGDLVVALSSSGETEELLALLPALQRMGSVVISLCGAPESTLAQASEVFLDAGVTAEACALNLAPTASTTVMLALGDALALEVS